MDGKKRLVVGQAAWPAASFLILVFACGDCAIESDRSDISLPVTFERATIFTGGYQEIGVQIARGWGLEFEDLDFRVDPLHGRISLARGPDFDPTKPTIMLIVGSVPGVHDLSAFHRKTGLLVGKGEFEVRGGLWPIDEEGPPIVFEDRADFDALEPEPAQGKLGITKGPPRTGMRKVLVVHLDTATRRYPSDFDPSVWGEVFGSTKAPSVLRYIEEVSSTKLWLEVEVAPLVLQLPLGFESYFHETEEPGRGWVPKEAIYEAIALFAKGTIDLEWADDLVFVALDPDPWVIDPGLDRMVPGERWILPQYAGRPTYSLGQKSSSVNTLFVAHERVHSDSVDEAVHLYGHALGLPDLFIGRSGATSGDDDERGVSSFDPMAGGSRGLPHFSMYSKVRLGWVAEDELAIFDLGESGQHAKTIMRTSFATEKPDYRPVFAHPAAGYLLAPGLAYLWEHRHTPEDRPSGIADRNLPAEPIVYGTEYDKSGLSPLRMIVPNHGEGPFLSNPGHGYEENDGGDLESRAMIQLTLGSIDAVTADFTMRRGESARPEPHIRPWKRVGRLGHRSEDVFLRNARNWDGKSWGDPDARWDVLVGAENRIVARVHNAGPVDAPGVKVVFRTAEWGAGQGEEDWITLSSATVDVPARSSVTVLSDPWILRSDDGAREKTRCIQAAITGFEHDLGVPYFAPGTTPPLLEVNPGNNRAQSCVARFTASPSTRVEQRFRVHNPFDEERVFRLEVQQNNPLFRTYLGHRWVTVPPLGHRDVPVLVEYAGDGREPAVIDAFRDFPNTIHIQATTFHGEDDFRPVGGATLVVRRGDPTEIVKFTAIRTSNSSDVLVRGEVRDAVTGLPAPDAVVIVSLLGDASDPITERVSMQGGEFEVRVPGEGWQHARALYVPPPGYAESESPTVANPHLP